MYYVRQFYRSKEGVLSGYQGFAMGALVTLIFLIAVFPSVAFRTAVIIGGVFVLFVLGARSELYAFLALSAVLSIVFGSKSIKYTILLLLAFVITFLFIEYIFEAISSSRQFEVLDLSTSSSWIERQALQEIAIRQIMARLLNLIVFS